MQYRKKLSSILGKVGHSLRSNSHTIFAKLLTLRINDDLARELFALTADDPLLTHRIWRLYRHYGEPKEALKKIGGHDERIRWQLNRLYRVRNSLVHAGRSPAYTDTLVLNALEYLRSAVMTIVRVSTKTGASSDLDQCIAEIGFEWRAMVDLLEARKGQQFDEDLAHEIFSAL